MRAYTPAQCVQSGFYARLCEKRGALAVAKRRLKLLMTDQRRSAFLLPRPLTHLIGFQCLKRARHQRCVCQSAGSHFQFGLSQLFITDKQTFSSARRNARAEQMGGGGGWEAGAFRPSCMCTKLDSGAKCIQKSGELADTP